MKIDIKPTRLVDFSPTFPKTVLEAFIASDSEIYRNHCVQALSHVVRSQGEMTLVEETADRTCDLFEAVILHLLSSSVHEDESGPWGTSKSHALMDAYLYVTHKHHMGYKFDASGIRKSPTWLPRALSFLVRCQSSVQEEIYEPAIGMKQFLFYASWCGGEIAGVEDYLAEFLKIRHEVLSATLSDSLITPDGWSIVEKVLRFIVRKSFFPPKVCSALKKLEKAVEYAPSRFYTDEEFGQVLWLTAKTQLLAARSKGRRVGAFR